MTETKKPDFADINALAMEACDMWQEHLSNLANDPKARAELTRFLEPQRRLFADWASMMFQGGAHGSARAQEDTSTGKKDAPSGTAAASPPPSAPSGDAPHGDDPLRAAQLALRLAELEKRVAKLEFDAVDKAERA